MNPLRAYIRRVLMEGEGEEVAPGKYGSMKDMALMVDSARYNSIYVLYKPKYYARKIDSAFVSAKGDYQSIRFKGDMDFKGYLSFGKVRDLMLDPDGVYGYIQVLNGRQEGLEGSCNKANEVTHVSARRGYSTFMYEIALLKHSPIMPDREGISPKAKEMWDYLYNERPDVEKEAFENELGLHPKTESDCYVYKYKPLDHSYSAEEKYHIENLRRKNDLFLYQLQGYLEERGADFVKTRAKEYIVDAGKMFYESDEEGWGEDKLDVIQKKM